MTPRAELSTCTLGVGGMDCSSCAQTVEKALRSVEGVQDVRVDLMGERVTVAYAERALEPRDLADAIRRAGYRVLPETGAGGSAGALPLAGTRAGARTGTGQSGAGQASVQAAGRLDPRSAWWARHGQLALVIASGVLWAFSLGAYSLGGASTLAAALAVGAIVTGGWHIVPRGIRAARNRALDMNFLMTIAAAGALVIGEFAEAATAMFLFALAQLLEARSMDRARDSIRALMRLSPAEATVVRAGAEVRVPVEQVAIGEVVVVRPGEKIPVDGEVLAGESGVDQAPITGESLPVEKAPGAEVFAGTLNGEGVLEVRTTKAAEDTTLARIIHAVEEAQASRAPSQAFVDRFARVYTPAVVLVALGIAVLPPLVGVGAWGEWFYRALVLLVVACPCALVISTPVTIVSALAGAAREGVLIKGGLHLENAGRADVVALDKTGTLTEGVPTVVDVVALDGSDPSALLTLAAAAESRSSHPLARAIVRRAREDGLMLPPATDDAAWTGRGHRARVGDEEVFVGGERMLEALGIDTAPLRGILGRYEAEGRTAVAVATRAARDAEAVAAVHSAATTHAAGGVGSPSGAAAPAPPEVRGVIAISDRVRPAAAPAPRRLHEAGIRRVVMLTGDGAAAARAVADSLGGAGTGVDDIRAGLLPEEKVEAVHELRAEGRRVLFVGDGINDAPALAAADVGVAMGTAGTDVALETADIALMADDLGKLPVAIHLARKAERIIRSNIAFALGSKAIFVGLAVAGVATLWMAVLADMGASLLVVANGLRALRS